MEFVITNNVEDLGHIPSRSSSIYRDMVISALERLDENPELILKLEYEFPSKARNTARDCRNWVARGENIKIISRQYAVYFIRAEQ